MRNFYCVNFEGRPADLQVKDCIITGARWLRRNNKSQVIISNKDEGLRVIVKTDFEVHHLGNLTGILFHADYAHDGSKGVMHMILTPNVLDQPETEEDVMVLARFVVFGGPKKKEEIPTPSRN